MKISNWMKNKATRGILKSAILAPAFIALNAFAQATSTSTSTTPGVPSTGVGGSLPVNLVLLAVAAVAIIAGAFQLKKTQ
jgi:hypothetical protein